MAFAKHLKRELLSSATFLQLPNKSVVDLAELILAVDCAASIAADLVQTND